MGHYSLRGQEGKNPMMNWSGTKPGEYDISEAKWRKNFRKEGVTKSVENFWDVWKDKDWEIVIELARWRSLVTSRNECAGVVETKTWKSELFRIERKVKKWNYYISLTWVL